MIKKLHTHFSSKYRWYARWHAHPHSTKVHYAALLVFIGLMALSISHGSARSMYGTPSSPEALAEANGLYLLKEGEYAVLQEPGNGKVKSETITLKSGGTITENVSGGTKLSVVEYTPGQNIYVPKNSPNVSVHSIEDFTNYDGKVDTAVERSLHGKDKVKVIVEMNLPYKKYFDKADNANGRAAKNQSFNNGKASVLKSAGLSKGKDLQIINGVALEVSAHALANLQKNPNVSHVLLDRHAQGYLDTSVAEINAPYAWNTIGGNNTKITGVGMRIAVIDTGVDYTHPDLGGCFGPGCKVIGGWDFVNNDADPMDDQGHGTHVAATAAGKATINGVVLNGVAPDASIIAYKVLDSSGGGDFSNIIAAIQKSVDPNGDGDPSDHVDVGTMSLGALCTQFGQTYSDGCGPNDPGATAVNNAVDAGVIYTIAAGNAGPTSPSIGTPGVAAKAITVAAACKDAQVGTVCGTKIANFSSRGPVIVNGVDYQKPDIAAPGVYICAARWGTAFAGAPTCFDDHHIRISGTSMATPHMAGVAALMKQANPALTPQQIKDRLKQTTRQLAGLTYNDEGAGEVDVQAALPNFNIISTPDILKITTDPTIKNTVKSQSFTVKSSDSTITTPTLVFNSPKPGISATLSKSTLALSNLGTDSFTATITIDNDSVPTGQYTTFVDVMQGTVKKGSIPILVTVTPTVTSDKTDIYYGDDDPTISSWTSAPQTITVTNKRADISQTITVSSAPQTGVTFQNSPSTLTIAPGSSATFTTAVTAANGLLQNGTYNVDLLLTNATNNTPVHTKFYKYFVIQFNNPTNELTTGTTSNAIVGITGMGLLSYFNPPSNSFKLYLNEQGNYDTLTVYYSDKSADALNHIYVNENIPVASGTTGVTIGGRSAATNKVSIIPTGFDGGTPQITDALNFYMKRMKPTEMLLKFAIFGMTNPFYSNNITTDQRVTYVAPPIESGTSKDINMFGGDRMGISGDWAITNTVADVKTVMVEHHLNLPDGTTILPTITTNLFGAGWGNGLGQQLPYTQYLHTTLTIPEFSYSIDSDASRGTDHRFMRNIVPALENGTTVYNGLGPVLWASHFQNSSSQISISSVTGSMLPIMRQDEKAAEYTDPIPYTISQNGSTVYSGLFPAFTVPAPQGNLLGTIPVAAGPYELTASFPYLANSVSLSGSVVTDFDTSKADPNPPYIGYVHITGNGNRTEVYDSSVTETLETNLNPDGGTMSSASLEFAPDGGTYAAVPLTNANGVYTATLPKVTITNKATLRIKATDSSGNSLQYVFDLPKGTAPAPKDSVAPTVSMTSPTDGSTVTGTITLTANATDNVGVTKVVFYLDNDNNPISTVTIAPFTTTYNVGSATGGAHTVYAKAYDAGGNASTSQKINITVTGGIQPSWVFCANENQTCTFSGTQNVHYGAQSSFVTKSLTGPILCNSYTFGTDPLPGNTKACYLDGSGTDTTPPTTSITSPATGATINGTVAVTATATDNIGVDHVDFYQGTTLIGAAATAPYTVNWNTTTVPNGSYTLTAKAYDAAGNVGTSSGVSVTVSNTVTPPPDTTAPTTLITAPANNATVSGTATISASATDNVGVTKVSFYRGTTLIDTDTTGSPDYAITWDTTTVPNGTYTITAKAYDAANNVGTSSPITVTVSNGTTPGDTTPPTVSITAPANGTVYSSGVTVTISATATDNVGVTKTELYVNNSLLCSTTGVPSCTWKTPKGANKTYTITAKAYDAAGNVGTSPAVKVTVKK